MSEDVNMDVSLVCQTRQPEKDSCPEPPESDTRNDVVPERNFPAEELETTKSTHICSKEEVSITNNDTKDAEILIHSAKSTLCASGELLDQLNYSCVPDNKKDESFGPKQIGKCENTENNIFSTSVIESAIIGIDQCEIPPQDVNQDFMPVKTEISGEEPCSNFVPDEVENSDALEQQPVTGVESGQNKTETIVPGMTQIGQSELPLKDITGDSDREHIEKSSEDKIKESSVRNLDLAPENSAKSSDVGPQVGNASKDPGFEQKEPTKVDAPESSNQASLVYDATPVQSRKRESSALPPISNTRVLRSRLKEKSPASESTNTIMEEGVKDEKKRKKQKRQMKKTSTDEFSRIKVHLRYLLHRIRYEQNLIDAYSAEGWKGQSLEKLKPEKELQRAKSQIIRYKLKIRDLFQRLDQSLAQGRIPESLFDSQGEIDSEDIFCAKCGSKDLPADNDIILCDGVCERGFHQFCLNPPLLKEDIPPGDERWLCPGCECKIDCIRLLNGSQGTNLLVTDNWEKVFAKEAAAAVSGEKPDNDFPSDDSEDDDFNPDNPDEDDEELEKESSSEESDDYYSASDDLAAPLNDEQLLGLPSDDSEDDDFNPNTPDDEELVEIESSSSDFTSESEDFGGLLNDNATSGEHQDDISDASELMKSSTESDVENFKLDRKGMKSLNSELSYLLQSGAAPVSGKRHVERLHYKRLHDETYGDISSDSSDEEFIDSDAPKRRKVDTGKPVINSPDNDDTENTPDADAEKNNQEERRQTAKKRSRKKLESTSDSQARRQKNSPEADSSGRSNGRSAYRRLSNDVHERLFESFKQNQYPKREVKENLAKELGISFEQVSKWFGNARWSFRHLSRKEPNKAEGSSGKDTSPTQLNDKSAELEPEATAKDALYTGVQKLEEPKVVLNTKDSQSAGVGAGATEEAGGQNSTSPKSERNNAEVDRQAPDNVSTAEQTLSQDVLVGTPNSAQAHKSTRSQSKGSKSAA